MPIGDVIQNADVAQRPDLFIPNGGENMSNQCQCNMPPVPDVGYPWIPVPPVPVPPPVPIPYYPPYPIPPMPPIPPVDPDIDPEKGSASQQICKLSRKANIITKMLENLTDKKKDAIITVAGLSYNFGNIDLSIDGWTDGSYAATVQRMLEFELGLIKAKIAELAQEIGDEATGANSGIETTVGG